MRAIDDNWRRIFFAEMHLDLPNNVTTDDAVLVLDVYLRDVGNRKFDSLTSVHIRYTHHN